MSPFEVLGVEIVNYEGDGLRALVPRIVGLTEAAREHKATGSRQSMDEIWAAAPDSTLRARQLLDGWATELHIQQWDSGKSRRDGPSSTSRPPVFLYPTYDQVFLMLKHVSTADAEQAGRHSHRCWVIPLRARSPLSAAPTSSNAGPTSRAVC